MRDSIDFSKMERITPREDSWDKVCARLDKAEKERTLKFSFFSAIPIAASFLLVGFSLFLRSMDANETAPAIKNQVAASDMATADVAASQTDSAVILSNWYSNLGQGVSDQDALDELQFISYLFKVQSALLEAMQERQVTIGEQTFKLDDPFLVLATQNPIEQEGTYPLPEAQVDRFLMKVLIGYPSKSEESDIIRMNIAPDPVEVRPLVTPADIVDTRKVVQQIYIDEKIQKYIVDIVFATRFPADYGLNDLKSMISFGASPRASINMALASRAYAFLRNRGYVIPEDVRAVCHDVMRHRLGLSYEAEANNITADEIISNILDKIAVP